jgi:hypothetical protein
MFNNITAWLHTLNILDEATLLIILTMHRVVSLLGVIVYSLYSLIGTIAHEFMHWIIAFILGANPTFPNLIPEKTSIGWRLGSVSFTPGLIKNIPIAMAPFVLAPIGLWWAATYMHDAKGWWYLIHTWIAGTLLISSLPSSQDWKIAAQTLIIGSLVGWAIFHF